MSKWTKRREQILAMVAAGMTDEEIAAVFGVTSQRINGVRAKLGIPTMFKRKRKSLREVFSKQEPPQELPVVNGVKMCPTRWLEGAGRGPTARPRR